MAEKKYTCSDCTASPSVPTELTSGCVWTSLPRLNSKESIDQQSFRGTNKDQKSKDMHSVSPVSCASLLRKNCDRLRNQRRNVVAGVATPKVNRTAVQSVATAISHM